MTPSTPPPSGTPLTDDDAPVVSSGREAGDGEAPGHAEHTGAHTAARRHGLRALLAEMLRFGAVGGVAFVVDVGLFNVLRFGPGELLGDKPITAKIVSAAVATLVAWLGNRYWAFAHHRTDAPVRELVGFVLANVGGALIAVGCLAFSHYVLDLTSPMADNISANVVGLALGTAFRYVAYKWFVFTGSRR